MDQRSRQDESRAGSPSANSEINSSCSGRQKALAKKPEKLIESLAEERIPALVVFRDSWDIANQ